MKIVQYSKEKHYQSLVKVWVYHKLIPYPAPDYLPSIGLVVETDDGIFIAALFMYLIPNEAAFIDWGVGNPCCPHEMRRVAFRDLMTQHKLHAKLAGAKFIYSISKIKPFLQMLAENDMQVAETGMTTMVFPLAENNMSFIKD
jgi:hypothetical protein